MSPAILGGSTVESSPELPRPLAGREAAAPGDWDLIYRTGQYRRYWDFGDHSPELLAYFLTHDVPAGAAALDLGCGAGHDSLFLARLGFRTVGLDISGEALKIGQKAARAAGLDITWKKGNAAELPFPDAAFHFVSDRGCLHHVPEIWRRSYAEEVARVLEPGGTLLLRAAERFFGANPVTAESLAAQFDGLPMEQGPIFPVLIPSEWGELKFNFTLFRKRS